MAKSIMFQGTASNVGKSILAAGFCRVFLEDGFSVAPFKAQNMALNSYVTEDGLEMGRAQVTQAAACRIKPSVHMNPVLLKPSSEKGAQVVVMGKPAGHMNVQSYTQLKQKLRGVIHEAYDYLDSRYDLLVIEGAGSPAEVNLKQDDITNMYVAKMAKCPVIIIGDIDRGGVYAHLIGTFDLLDEIEQELTAGFIINKFRGDESMLNPANEFLEERTGRKLFGVMPWINQLGLPDEDSVEFKNRVGKAGKIVPDKINIAVVDLPHISNFTDLDVFDMDEDVNLSVTRSPVDLEQYDMVILPGSKNSLKDIETLRSEGFEPALRACVEQGTMVVGICGGYQMLGREIRDPGSVESDSLKVPGFGFLDIITEMSEEKRLTQVTGFCPEANTEVTGYEIHHGTTRRVDPINKDGQLPTPPDNGNERLNARYSSSLRGCSGPLPFLISQDSPENILGSRNETGNVWGTYVHGIFDRGGFRNYILNKLREKKGLPLTVSRPHHDIDAALSRLADQLRQCVDMDALYRSLK